MTDTVKEIIGMILFALILVGVSAGGCAVIAILGETIKEWRMKRIRKNFYEDFREDHKN